MKQNSSLILGEKVKDIHIDQKKYRWMIFALLVLFNILLIIGFVYVSISIPQWYVFLICSLVWVPCVVESIRIFIKSKSAYKYEVYENCMLIQTLYSKFIIKFEDVFMVKTKKSLLDKMAGNKTNSLLVYTKSKVREKVVLPFIAEDEKLLIQTIMQKAIDSREKNKTSI